MILNYFNNVKGNRQGEFFLLPAHGTGGARATPFLAALFAEQKTKFGGGGKRGRAPKDPATAGLTG